jgi:hypothetical protein
MATSVASRIELVNAIVNCSPDWPDLVRRGNRIVTAIQKCARGTALFQQEKLGEVCDARLRTMPASYQIAIWGMAPLAERVMPHESHRDAWWADFRTKPVSRR